MAWQLSWIGEAGEQPMEVLKSERAARELAESLAGDLDWEPAWVLGDSPGEEEDVLVAVSDTAPDGSWAPGEYIVAKASWARKLGAPIRRYSGVQQEDRDNPLVPVVDRAIQDRKYLAYEYTNSKRKTHPALLHPIGWRTFQHAHNWAGGYTLCVVGYCYYHKEERHYAIRRMADVRVLDHPAAELARLGWTETEEPTIRQGSPRGRTKPTEHARPVLADGALVEHDQFGRGEVLHVDIPRRRITVLFDTVGTKKLALNLAPLRVIAGE